jgi:hypothetical protein
MLAPGQTIFMKVAVLGAPFRADERRTLEKANDYLNGSPTCPFTPNNPKP